MQEPRLQVAKLRFYMTNASPITFTVQPDQVHTRLDKFLSTHMTTYSRSFLAKLIENGHVLVNNSVATKPSAPLKEADVVTVNLPPKNNEPVQNQENQLSGVTIIYENDDFLVINKPAGLTIHTPHTHSTEFTLAHWIAKRYPEVANVGSLERPGIVHRLDKDTSGIVIIARTNYAHIQFSALFKNRTINKTYLALVTGHTDAQGSIDLAIGRSQHNKTKMATFAPSKYTSTKTRHALTHYKAVEYFDNATLLEVKPVTGRTHQIRVHCAAIGHSIIGDKVYGTKSSAISRQALHAYQIAFEFNGTPYFFTAPLPEDFNQILDQLRTNNS